MPTNQQVFDEISLYPGPTLRVMLREALGDHTSRNLMLLRAIRAAFTEGDEFDSLPCDLRPQLLATVHLPDCVRLPLVQELLEDEGHYASANQELLGQMGYVILWAALTGTEVTESHAGRRRSFRDQETQRADPPL